MTVDEVKRELRELKHLEKCIKVRETIRDIRMKRLNRLRQMPKTPETEREMEEIKEIIKTLNIRDYVKRANALEKKYFGIISTLSPNEQIIVFECFVNGDKTYWQVGEQLGYSDEWVRAKVREIASTLACRMTTA